MMLQLQLHPRNLFFIENNQNPKLIRNYQTICKTQYTISATKLKYHILSFQQYTCDQQKTLLLPQTTTWTNVDLTKEVSRAPFHKSFFRRNSNSMEISFHTHLDFNIVVATKFCTWHNSCAVVACAKMVAIWWPATKSQQGKFPSNLNCGQKVVSETGPYTIHHLPRTVSQQMRNKITTLTRFKIVYWK